MRILSALLAFVFGCSAFGVGKVVCASGEKLCLVKDGKVEVLLEANGGRIRQKFSKACSNEHKKDYWNINLELLDGDTNEMVGLGRFTFDLSKAPCKPHALRISYLKFDSIVRLKY